MSDILVQWLMQINYKMINKTKIKLQNDKKYIKKITIEKKYKTLKWNHEIE